MNCKELRAYSEQGPIYDGFAARESEISAHLADCGDCREFFAIRNETAASLRLLRETAPPISASLDAKVLANYRRQIAASEAEPTRWALGFITWRVASAFVTLILVLGLAIWAHRTTKKPDTLSGRQGSVAYQPTTPNSRTEVHQRVADRGMVTTERHETASARPPSAIVPTPVADDLETSPSDGFRSLMYCDDLSCGGGMQMVRVELPARAVGLTQVNVSPREFVTADVLVGSDGFARGIRIVH